MKPAVEGHRKDKLKHLRLDEIIVGERFRQDFGDLDELVSSIKEKGIIQPITVDSNMNLLAGGRRFAAAQKIGLPTVPAIIRDFIDTLDSREIELFENIYRKDFTWDERAMLTESIDSLYKEKYKDVSLDDGRTVGWSGRKTAELLERSVMAVARDLQLAQAIKAIPQIRSLKTADEALKFVKKLEEDSLVTELRNRQKAKMEDGESGAEETTVDDGSDGAEKAAAAKASKQLDSGLRAMLRIADQAYNVCDVFKGLSNLRTDGNITLIECDPPYGIDLNTVKGSRENVASNVHSYEEIDADLYPMFLKKLCTELYRVAGKDCWMVFWFGPTWGQRVLAELKNAGWIVDEIPAVWTKAQGQTLQPELYFARGYEPFYLCRKGKPVMVERGRLNVFNFPAVPPKQKYHPTQRPLELICEIFSTLAAGRAHVLVPFLGSGTSLLACYELGFVGTGFDLNGEYKDKFMLAVEKQTRALYDTETE